MTVVTSPVAVTDSAAVKLASGSGADRVSGTAGALWTLSGSDSIFVGPTSAVTATGGTKGSELPGGGTLGVSLQAGEEVWARCATGKSATVQRVLTGT